MVFKGRFFSSKKSDSSSPDASSNNSPRSFGSDSPSRSDKKKVKSAAKEPQIANSNTTSGGGGESGGRGFGSAAASGRRQTLVKDGAKKDVKGKESQSQAESRLTPLKPVELGGFSSGSKSKKSAQAADGKESPAKPKESPSSSVSPILASSLGLNKIKTRSGPLPQESFLGFRSDNKGSNLSRFGGSGKKKETMNQSKVGFQDSLGIANWVDNGSNSDSNSTGSAPSRDQSPNVLARSRLQNGGESSSAATGMHLHVVVNVLLLLTIMIFESLESS